MKKYILLTWFLVVLLPITAHAQKSIPILVYHSIDEFTGSGSRELYVTPQQFEKQIIYLRDHGFTLLTFEKWAERNRVDKPIFITFDDGYKNNLNAYAIFQTLKNDQFTPTGTIFVISDYIGGSKRLSQSYLRMLANSELFSIQSHTATHPDLTATQDIEKELKGSKEAIQEITNRTVIAISYPYGNVNKKIVEEVKKYYQFGLTTTPGPFNESGVKDEQFYLPRTYIKYSTSLNEFAQIVEGN
ncbi:polysaccharide deacetylase family protein [Bacillus sp. B15-48]|uniref:polysaccharide deacetylase family protein n=1 Tax=Bacillus sp. B15-48 TaxID=1548601 RepID=UPI00193FEF72|nr:polysaccharide deacetylase family protein [Bacillus sp. B15-48]MBM4764805.1 polysaccharide deacetylase family protein [Bacillus sp. B15-48]